MESIIIQFDKNKRFKNVELICTIEDFGNFINTNPWICIEKLIKITNLTRKKIFILFENLNLQVNKIDDGKNLILKNGSKIDIYQKIYNFTKLYLNFKNEKIYFAYFDCYNLNCKDGRVIQFFFIWYNNNKTFDQDEFFRIDCLIVDGDEKKSKIKNTKIKKFLAENVELFGGITRFCIHNSKKFNLKNYCLGLDLLNCNLEVVDEILDPTNKNFIRALETLLYQNEKHSSHQFYEKFFGVFTNSFLKNVVNEYNKKIEHYFESCGFF